MADSKTPKVKSEEVLMFDADGLPTTDKRKAVSAEIVQTFEDGTKQHNVMRKPPQHGAAG
jgi:hypothetical protein